MNDFTKEQYTCEKCNEKFLKAWTDKEAEAEFSDAIYNIPGDERALICDDCFVEFQKWISTLTADDHKRIKNE